MRRRKKLKNWKDYWKKKRYKIEFLGAAKIRLEFVFREERGRKISQKKILPNDIMKGQIILLRNDIMKEWRKTSQKKLSGMVLFRYIPWKIN